MGRIGRWVRRLGASGERTAHHIDFLAPLDDDSFREAAQDLILTEVQLRLRHRASWCGIIIAAKSRSKSPVEGTAIA